MRHHLPANERSAFTLVELLLALALTVVITSLVTSAIEFHLRQMTIRRSGIEEAQVARAILQRIADDLRAVVVYRTPEVSTVDELAESLLGEGAGDLTGDLGGAGSSTDPDPSGSSTSSDMSGTSEDELSTTLVPLTPGIYGNMYQLQIDVSRIPRYEEYDLLSQYGGGIGLSTLSDTKTVTYFLANGSGTTGLYSGSAMTSGMGMGTSMGTGYGGMSAGSGYSGIGGNVMGLARSVLNRAASRYAQSTADIGLLDQQTELLAPEVMAVEFAYFDGLQWYAEWDTEIMGGIPMAVEITLLIRPTNDTDLLPASGYGMAGQGLSSRMQPGSGNAGYNSSNMTSANESTLTYENIYRLVVHLPAAELLVEETDTTTTEDTTTSSSTSGGGL